MALRKVTRDTPADIEVMTESQAVKSQWELISKWTPKSDTWAFRYSVTILGAASALSSLFINAHYRFKLKLRHHGGFVSALPTAVIPTICSSLFHHNFVTNDILLEKTSCPVCVHLRSASIQILFSTVYPSLLAPCAAFMFASRHFTYKLPPVTKPMENFKLWIRLTKPIGNLLFVVALSQALLAMGLAHFEAGSYFKVRSSLLEIERKVELEEHLKSDGPYI